jgi:hypothetical protein
MNKNINKKAPAPKATEVPITDTESDERMKRIERIRQKNKRLATTAKD